jgi:hypothetical protein
MQALELWEMPGFEIRLKQLQPSRVGLGEIPKAGIVTERYGSSGSIQAGCLRLVIPGARCCDNAPSGVSERFSASFLNQWNTSS